MGGARPRRGSRGELQGSLGFQENCHPRDCEQVEIGHKGTKEGSATSLFYSPHSASLSDQPAAEVGPTYWTRGG